ncbi:unnamed protein product [Bursaphelenchus okinawaensis]|uniref:Uncharacterized protein n=1 Tax=Bursaphelenchus okinawaensis TaxID=465554 RepID=A0A811K214_9BILA|nr:unnamed protein product [Bursaphelenchus okinawaensis]CAG9089360.1 unnamed protein product [Bursaphelenchus okinawaensis]
MGSCFGTGPKVTLLNLSPSAITDQEIVEKAKTEFRQAETPAQRLRFGCIATGISHLKSFARYVRHHPNITLKELHDLVTKLAVSFTDSDLDELIQNYVKNGRIDTPNYCDDSVEVAKFLRNFCFKHDREYVSGRKSDAQVVDEFKKKFNLGEHEDGKVDLDDFINYYGSISYGCHSDAYFDLLLRQTWNY